MIALQGFLTPFYTDFKYATSQNFTNEVLYAQPEPYLRLPAARALKNALSILKDKGLTIKIYDAYRPYSVTKKMWEIVPDERYAANPTKGSSHNRGTAIDVTLVYLKTGVELKMPTEYDNFTTKAHHNNQQLPKKVIKNRALLKRVMEQAGFVPLNTEWWHYTFKGSGEQFQLLDLDFSQLKQVAIVWNN